MFANLLNRIKQAIHTGVRGLRKQVSARTKPVKSSLVLGSLSDLVRTRPQLVAENALLRQVGRRDVFQHPTPKGAEIASEPC